MKIYIGNISFNTTEDQLRDAFTTFGEVTSLNIITDKYDNRPKGFAFIEMSSKEEATAAIAGLNGKDLNGRALNVNEAKPKVDNGNRPGNNKYKKLY